MLPVTPAGHSGWPAGPGRIGPAATPSVASAALAHDRPAANSARRRGPAVRTASASAGRSPGAAAAGLPTDSADAAAGGRRPAISPAGRPTDSAAAAAGGRRPATGPAGRPVSAAATAGGKRPATGPAGRPVSVAATVGGGRPATGPAEPARREERGVSAGITADAYCGLSAIQTACASVVPGLRQVCGWSPRKCSVLPAPTWYDCPVTVNSSTPLVTWTSSSPGCCMGLRPLVAPGATVARAPASRNRPYGPEMLLRSIPLCEV